MSLPSSFPQPSSLSDGTPVEESEVGDAELAAELEAIAANGEIPATSDEELGDAPYIPALYNISRRDCGTAYSTEMAFKTIWKHWVAFKTAQDELPLDPHPNFGLGIYGHTQFSKEDGGDDRKWDEQLVYDFFDYLAELDFSIDNLTKAVSFMHAHMRGEFYARLRAVDYRPLKVSTAKIGSSSKLQNIFKEARLYKAIKAWEKKEDILADVDEMMSLTQIRAMIVSTFEAQPHEAIAKMEPLLRVQFPPAFNSAMMTGRRGEEQYKQRAVQRFVRPIRKLGPLPGTVCSFAANNNAKHNKVGRVEYSACAPHVDPFRDPSAMHGVMWLYRFVVANEPLPDFTNYKTAFDFPTYRTAKKVKNMDGDGYRDLWRPFYTANDVVVGKVTHQSRREVEQLLDDAGCKPESIARHCGHQAPSVKQTTVQTQSYLTNPPLECVVTVAGGDRSNPNLHIAIVALGERFVSEAMIGKISKIAQLLAMRDAIHAAHSQCKSQKERMDKRLCTLKRSIDSIVVEIKRAFVLFVTRPIDPETFLLQPNEKTMFETFYNGLLLPLFQHSVFESQEFLDLRAAVRELENKQHEHSSLLQPAFYSSQQQQLKDYLLPVQTAIFTELHSMRLERERDREQASKTLSGSLLPGPAQSKLLLAPAKQPVPLQQPPSKSDVPLKYSSEPRQKRPCIRQEDVHRAEEPTTVPRPLLKDDGIDSLRDQWKIYTEKWRPLEQHPEHTVKWRADRPVKDANGNWQRSKRNSNWWNKRIRMWQLVELYIEEHLANHPGCSPEEAEEAALVRGTDLYEIFRKSKNNKNYIFQQFTKEWKTHTGMTLRPGRKKGDRNSVFEVSVSSNHATASTVEATPTAAPQQQPRQQQCLTPQLQQPTDTVEGHYIGTTVDATSSPMYHRHPPPPTRQVTTAEFQAAFGPVPEHLLAEAAEANRRQQRAAANNLALQGQFHVFPTGWRPPPGYERFSSTQQLVFQQTRQQPVQTRPGPRFIEDPAINPEADFNHGGHFRTNFTAF